jgi:MFS transporter, ACS family, glucarate transporter
MPTSHVRHRVVGMTFLLASILYLDRSCLSIMAPAIRKDLDIGPMAMGWVFSAFVWGYAALHIPSGWLADRFGARKVLSAIVVLWSAFTAATAAAWSFSSLLVIRFLFGAGESGATPNVTRSFAKWIPETERARAQGFYFSGMSAGGALAPPLVAFCLLRIGWRATFLLLGALWIIWAVAWYLWFRDDPKDHGLVSPIELSLLPEAEAGQEHVSMNWRRLLRSGNLWAILLMYFSFGYTGYISITWFPTYLVEARHFPLATAGLLAAGPSVFGMLAKPLGGWWSDRLTLRHGVARGRKTVGVAAFALAAVAVLSGYYATHSYVAVLLLSMADGATALAHGVCFALCLDMGMKRAGTIAALMLTAGSLGNAASALVFGAFLQATSSWTAPFLIAAGADVLCVLAWLKIDPEEKLI